MATPSIYYSIKIVIAVLRKPVLIYSQRRTKDLGCAGLASRHPKGRKYSSPCMRLTKIRIWRIWCPLWPCAYPVLKIESLQLYWFPTRLFFWPHSSFHFSLFVGGHYVCTFRFDVSQTSTQHLYTSGANGATWCRGIAKCEMTLTNIANNRFVCHKHTFVAAIQTRSMPIDSSPCRKVFWETDANSVRRQVCITGQLRHPLCLSKMMTRYLDHMSSQEEPSAERRCLCRWESDTRKVGRSFIC